MKIEIGDLIKGFDFQPCPGRPDMYVVGIVERIGIVPREGYLAYEIRCLFDSLDKEIPAASRVGRTVYVPVQTSMDYDGRVSKV